WCRNGTARTSACPSSPRSSRTWLLEEDADHERPFHPRRVPRPVRPARPRAGPEPWLAVQLPGTEPLELPHADTGDAGSRPAPDADLGRASLQRGHPLAADLRALPRTMPVGLPDYTGEAPAPPRSRRRPWRPRSAHTLPPRCPRLPTRQLL